MAWFGSHAHPILEPVTVPRNGALWLDGAKFQAHLEGGGGIWANPTMAFIVTKETESQGGPRAIGEKIGRENLSSCFRQAEKQRVVRREIPGPEPRKI